MGGNDQRASLAAHYHFQEKIRQLASLQYSMTKLAPFALAVAIASSHAADTPLPSGVKLLYEQDFQKPDAIKDFVMTDPTAWKVAATNERRSLELTKQSNYKPPVRSP